MARDKENKKKVGTKKRFSTKNKIVLFVVEILLLLLLVILVKVWKMVDGIQMDSPLTQTEAGINKDIGEESLLTMSGYTNIALFGLDNRSNDQYNSGNSDSIMIASVNNETKEIRIVSVYRDTYLNVGTKTNGEPVYSKINSAYARGGVKNAVQMLNQNLDLDIMAYVCVDWNALTEAIDELGGIELIITDKEVELINHYVRDTARCSDKEPHEVTESGKVLLDGLQATSYARIRYTKGMDFERASRQRIVLQAMLEKAKKADIATLTSICNVVFDDIQTSLSLKDILFLAKSLPDYQLVSTSGFPTSLSMIRLNGADIVVPVDLCANVEELHEYLFGEENYVPSQSVLDRNNAIIEITGQSIENADPSDMYDPGKLLDVVGSDGTTGLWEKEESTENSTEE